MLSGCRKFTLQAKKVEFLGHFSVLAYLRNRSPHSFLSNCKNAQKHNIHRKKIFRKFFFWVQIGVFYIFPLFWWKKRSPLFLITPKIFFPKSTLPNRSILSQKSLHKFSGFYTIITTLFGIFFISLTRFQLSFGRYNLFMFKTIFHYFCRVKS